MYENRCRRDRTFHVIHILYGLQLSVDMLSQLHQYAPSHSRVFFHFKHLVTTIVFLLRDNDATLIYILICSIYRRRCYHRYQGRWQLQRRHGRESRGYFKLSEGESLFTVQQGVSWWQKEQYLPLEQTTSSGSQTSFAASLWPKQERRKLWISVTYSKPTMKLRTSIARNIYRIRRSIHIRELLTQR